MVGKRQYLYKVFRLFVQRREKRIRNSTLRETVFSVRGAVHPSRLPDWRACHRVEAVAYAATAPPPVLTALHCVYAISSKRDYVALFLEVQPESISSFCRTHRGQIIGEMVGNVVLIVPVVFQVEVR